MAKLIFLFALLMLPVIPLIAQGEGPKSQLPSPVGVWAINVKYMNLDQNLLPSGNILLKSADIHADVIPITLIHTFAIKGRWARVYGVVPLVSNMNVSAESQPTIPRSELSTSGFSDGWIGFEMNIKGNPAKNVVEFSKQPPSFAINGVFKIWYSGTYDKDAVINLGSNRTAFEFGLPMAFNFSKDAKKSLWLESMPSVQFFTGNDEPSRLSSADEITQRPLFLLENHLTYNLNPKFYIGADLRIQQGGQTLSDDVEDDNRISILGGGLYAGYKFLPFLDFYANYGGILTGDNGARSEMIRLSLTFSYINMKKINASE